MSIYQAKDYETQQNSTCLDTPLFFSDVPGEDERITKRLNTLSKLVGEVACENGHVTHKGTADQKRNAYEIMVACLSEYAAGVIEGKEQGNAAGYDTGWNAALDRVDEVLNNYRQDT